MVGELLSTTQTIIKLRAAEDWRCPGKQTGWASNPATSTSVTLPRISAARNSRPNSVEMIQMRLKGNIHPLASSAAPHVGKCCLGKARPM